MTPVRITESGLLVSIYNTGFRQCTNRLQESMRVLEPASTTVNTMPRTSVMMESGTLANTKESLRLSTTTANGTLESTPAIRRRSEKTMESGILESMRASLRPSMMMANGTLASTLVERRSVRMMAAGLLANTRAVTPAVMMASGKLVSLHHNLFELSY